jgi:hypothetical protein
VLLPLNIFMQNVFIFQIKFYINKKVF